MEDKVVKDLTTEENKIIDYIEDGTAKSIPDVKNEMTRYTNMAKNYASKKKAISVRLTESDIYLLKQKALSTGISYQNIIQSLVHQYAHNKIKVAL